MVKLQHVGCGRLTVRDSETRFSDIGVSPTPHHDQTDGSHSTVFSYWPRVVTAVVCYSDAVEYQLASYDIRPGTYKPSFTFRTPATACWQGDSTSAENFAAREKGSLWSSVGGCKRFCERISSGSSLRISYRSGGGPRCVIHRPTS